MGRNVEYVPELVTVLSTGKHQTKATKGKKGLFEPNTCREEGLPYFCLNLPCHTWLLKEEDTVGFIKLGMHFSLSKQ